MNKDYFGLDKKRYETRGIAENLEISYRFILWMLVDEIRENEEVEADYLQVFEFVCETDDEKVHFRLKEVIPLRDRTVLLK